MTASLPYCLTASLAGSGGRSPVSGTPDGCGQVGGVSVSGFEDVVDLFEDNLTGDVDSSFPIGLTFDPYYQLENGIAFGVGVGPMIIGTGDVDITNIPVNLTGRYYITPEAAICPYVRAGVSYNFASGDFVEGSGVGFFGGAGVEFFRTSRVNAGLELMFDTSTIEFEKAGGGTGDIEPVGMRIGIFVIF